MLAINSAIFRAAELIASAVSDGSSSSKPAMEKHKELLETLQGLMIHDPESKKSKENEVAKAKKIIEDEFQRGPFKVQGMVHKRRGTRAGLY